MISTSRTAPPLRPILGSAGTVLPQRIHSRFIVGTRTLDSQPVRAGLMESYVMKKQLLMGAVLGVALGFSVSASNAAPATSMLDALKASAGENAIVEQARHRRRHKARKMCWWGDKWMCRYFW